jgi:hypothetical protein
MTCHKVRKLIPLAAGADLRPRLAAAVRAHADTCPGCREELEEFRAATDKIKAEARAQSVVDWGEGEWNALMARVAAEAKRTGDAPAVAVPRVFRPRWAAASALGAFLCLVVLGILFRGPSPQPTAEPDKGFASAVSGSPQQDKVAITIVSPETGLQVVWILDKNFDWKGDQE